MRAEFELVCFGGGAFDALEREQVGELAGEGCGKVRNVQGDDAMLAGAYRGATAFVCSSRYEGFGIPILEAMACGCPVVAAPVSSIPEVGGDAIVYSEDWSAEAFLQALETLLFNPEALAKAQKRGLVRSQRFSWESTAFLTLSGYRRIVG